MRRSVGSNCFSITRLVGQKKGNNKVSTCKLKKYSVFGENENRRISLLDDYYY